MHYYENKSIKEWVAEDRPREKLSAKGKESLTDAELLATLIASGTPKYSALDLARMLLEKYGSLKQLARTSVQELCKHPGIGQAKASNIMVAFEMGRRGAIEAETRKQYLNSCELGHYLCAKHGNLPHEMFHVMFLDNHCRIINEKELFRGGTNSTAVDPKLVFKEAIGLQAERIVVSHNHPSGSIVPSKADDHITQKLLAHARMVEIELIDHLIVAGNRWYSYSDTGEMGRLRTQVQIEFDRATSYR